MYNEMAVARKGLPSGLVMPNVISRRLADAAGMDAGAPVFGHFGDAVNVYNFYNDTAKLVFSADLVTSNLIDMDVNGVSMAQVTFTTDHLTTMGLIVAALNAMTGVEAVLDPADGTNRTLLIRVKGTNVAITNDVVTAGASQATITDTYDTSMIFMGIAREVNTGVTSYAQGDMVSVMVEGEVWVLAGKALKAQDALYVYATAGADFGKIYDSGFATGMVSRSSAVSGGLLLAYLNGTMTQGTYAEKPF